MCWIARTDGLAPRVSGRNGRRMSGPLPKRSTVPHGSITVTLRERHQDLKTARLDPRRQVRTEVLSELEANSTLGGEASDQAYYEWRRLLQKFVQVNGQFNIHDRPDEKYDIFIVELSMAEGRLDVPNLKTAANKSGRRGCTL